MNIQFHNTNPSNASVKNKSVFGKKVREAKVPGRTEIPQEVAPQMQERRTEQRRRVLKGANLYFNGGYGAFSCTVKNVSEKGALVAMEDSSGLPKEFDFRIKGEAGSRKATLGWSERGIAGILFV